MDHSLIIFISHYDLILILMNVISCFISQVHVLEDEVNECASYYHCLIIEEILIIIIVNEDAGFIIISDLISNCLLLAM